MQNQAFTTLPMQRGYTFVDPYGRPQSVYPMTYEQNLNYRRAYAASQRDYVEQRLQDNFPKFYVLAHAIVMIFLGVAEIALHIVLIVNNGSLYYVGHGIWAGVVLIILGCVAILLLITRKYSTLVLSYFMHFLSVLIIFGGLVIVNAIAISQYSSIFQETKFNPDMRPVNIAMLVIGVVGFIFCVGYFISIWIVVNGGCDKSFRNQSRYNYSNAAVSVSPVNFQYSTSTTPYPSGPYQTSFT